MPSCAVITCKNRINKVNYSNDGISFHISNEWSCNDGTCIDENLTCNGAIDCPDRRDKTYLLCRHRLGFNGHQCTYGACVPKSAVCNGVKNCADNSDELLFQCRNEAIMSSSLCKGDSGGGLVFPSHDRGEERYFLRGVVSTAPRNDHACNAFSHTTFTQISKHQAFILEYWN